MLIRELTPQDVDTYRALRLRGFQEHADAFTSSYEEEAQKPVDVMQGRLASALSKSNEWILGAFDGHGALTGVVGMSVDERQKVRHRGWVFGMFVPAEHARKGIGKALLADLIERARQREELELLHLTVTATNQGAIRLYESAGFVAGGIELAAIKVLGKRYDKLHMALVLRN
jgi:ribosomal protein S18 acetylase RimI-like enzyme